MSAAFEYQTRHAVAIRFSENVSASVSPSDLVLINLTTGQVVPSGSIAVAYDAATNTARFTFPGFANGVLPDGNYAATLPAGSVQDAAGNALATQYNHAFFFVNADANRDRSVNLADFGIVRANFGGSNKTFGQGDFNYDGNVNLADFGILRGRFGFFLPPPGGNLFGGGGGGGDDDGGGGEGLV